MKKKIGFIIGVCLLVLVVFYYFYNTKELYGNDKASIVNVIKSIDGYKDKDIEIMEITDFDDIRIAGFLSNNSPSIIEFNKNRKGNYVWRYVETRKDESFSMFLTQFENSKMMFVTNYENEIAKLVVDINGITIEEHFIPYQATVTWVDYPQTNKDHYE
ncbi:hypothetical protein QTL97_01410 [Sporosarcina thermotolerans]|uniref:Lipoprotein n=1 Tax=Sporosarcina thermotolerans TaxID=633404 RepID=A0AAW9A8Y9_9BACL|nr:hypothetical protein [Sporosarcina thermotolerans]MDW0115593.1 hypothetical protein [Sporosarcina thermotolerans]WHT47107.1 hypothetical protein QNH10_12535 [Sporosarcina thermotolerans]